MNSDKIVSVAMATYNGIKYLNEQIDSIITQTHKNIEIVVVDDCSTDGTFEMLLSIEKKFPNVRCFRNETNIGVAKTFERAISLTCGDYIVFSDQDDVWLENKIDILLNNIGDNLLIHSDAYLVDYKLNLLGKTLGDVKGEIRREFLDYLFANYVTGCTLMISRECKELAMPIPRDFYMHDHYFALIASYYKRISYLPIPLIKYRQHSSNAIGTSKMTYSQFIVMNGFAAKGFESLLKKDLFDKDAKNHIELAMNYRKSIVDRKFKFSIVHLIRTKGGVKKVLYYFFVSGFGSKMIAKVLYDNAKTIRRKIRGLS